MCTVTWEQYAGSGYRLLFNRDELITREPALPPQIFVEQSLKIIRPTDQRAGGTWIAVNSTGLSVCLINNYGAEKRIHSDSAPSRGKLVSAMALASDPDQAIELMHRENPHQYNPFDVFVFDQHGTPLCWRWDGETLSTESPVEKFAFSAGFDNEAVISNRRDLYHQWQNEAEDLADYHRSHIPSASSYSVCMHRHEAGTQSMSEIRVNQESVNFTYWPGPPCVTAAQPTLSVPRT